MQILIVGGGLVGSTLAARLSQSGRDVVLIERDGELARRLTAKLDVQVIEADGTLARVLREAGIEKADVVVAMTESDEANMVVAMLSATLFEVPCMLVRLRNAGHEEGFAWIARERHRDYRAINPVSAAVDRILALLVVPGALDVAPFMDGELLVAGFRIRDGSDLAGLTVSHMSLLFADAPTLVAAIQRGPRWIVPHGGEELRAGDIAYFAIARADLANVIALVRGEPARRSGGSDRPRVLIAGATRIGLDLARRLEAEDVRVVLIEEDPVRAREAAEQLGDTLVVHGHPTDETLLEEEDIERVSTFVAVTEDYEDNLVAGLLARRLGAERAFALIDNPDLVHLIGEVAIDAIISPRLLAVSLALQHIRGTGVRSVAALLEDRIEVIEAECAEGSRLVGKPLADLSLPRGMLIAALRRDGRIVVPRGHDRIEAGDTVLFVTTLEEAPRVSTLLSAD
ncbi:Trk system potassium transporter TrkA [Myxococcota bacterium]|nr:Trk system potassium transporter TrkA [Myxococcota bacterium]MCZ7620597.1 Trk system potassium transporter TrkA [Myxococcota bacterium]